MSLYLTSEMILDHVQGTASKNRLISLPFVAVLPFELWQTVVFYLCPYDLWSLFVCCQEMANLALSTSLIESYYRGAFVPRHRGVHNYLRCQRKKCESATTTLCPHDLYIVITGKSVRKAMEDMAIQRYMPVPRIMPCILSLDQDSMEGYCHVMKRKNGLGWRKYNLPFMGTLILVGEYLNDKEKGPWVSLRVVQHNCRGYVTSDSYIFAIVNLVNGRPEGRWYYQRSGKGWMTGTFKNNVSIPKIEKGSIRKVKEEVVEKYCAEMNIIL